MKRTLLAIFCVCILMNSFGQKDWSAKFNGYVLQRDSTITPGYLKFNGSSEAKGIKIELYKKPNERPQIFYAFDLLGYSYDKDTIKIFEHFELFGNHKKQFDYIEGKIETRGALTLYFLQIEAPSGWINNGPNRISYGSMVLNPEKIYAIESKNKVLAVVGKKNFKEVMISLLKDDHLLVNEIETNKLKFKDIKTIIKKHNQNTD